MAVTLTAADLAVAADLEDTVTAARLLAVATQVVEDYAPGAPEVLQNEAAIRFAGYLGSGPSGFGAVKQTTVGPLTVEVPVNHAAMFRNSGAAALLTRHRVRRGGAV